MPFIKKVDCIDHITYPKGWKTSQKFNCMGRFVDENNRYVNCSYAGVKYEIVVKKEIKFTKRERIERIALGIFMNILTLGLCNIHKQYRQIFTKDKRVLRYALNTSFVLKD